MNLTHITEFNFKQFLIDNPHQINLNYQITHWLDLKKKVLPDWHQYAFDEEGNVFYRCLLEEEKHWSLIVFNPDTQTTNYRHGSFQ